MLNCVSEKSYNLIFIVSLMSIIVSLIFFAYFYDRFIKINNNTLEDYQKEVAKNISLFSIIVGIVLITILLVVYFGFHTRYSAVMEKIK